MKGHFAPSLPGLNRVKNYIKVGPLLFRHLLCNRLFPLGRKCFSLGSVVGILLAVRRVPPKHLESNLSRMRA